MSFVATAAAVTVGGLQYDASSKAAGKQDAAAQQANALQRESMDEQKRIYEEQKGMYAAEGERQNAKLQPWEQAGTTALSGMQNADFQRDFTASDYQADPGYAFRMAEGQKALERSAAAKGGLQSGGTLKSLARYSQDVASNEYGNAYNRFNQDRDRRFGRLSSLAGMGQNATFKGMDANNQRLSMLTGAGQNYGSQYGTYANNVGGNVMGNANAQGAATIAQGNALSGAVAGVANNYQKKEDSFIAMATGGGGKR